MKRLKYIYIFEICLERLIATKRNCVWRPRNFWPIKKPTFNPRGNSKRFPWSKLETRDSLDSRFSWVRLCRMAARIKGPHL